MLRRFPNFQSILQVYAVIAVMLSGWTITAFLWKLSAWVLILNLGEIFALFSYAMFANLIESLIVLLLLIIGCVLLPPRILRDEFSTRGTILSIGIIGSLMAFVGIHMQTNLQSGIQLFIGPFLILLLTVFLLVFASRFPFVRSIHSGLLWLSDRLTVFLFILVPLFVILSIYVIVRNIA